MITVHVVDDEPELRRALARVLESGGYRVRACASADEFLDGLQETMSGRTSCARCARPSSAPSSHAWSTSGSNRRGRRRHGLPLANAR